MSVYARIVSAVENYFQFPEPERPESRDAVEQLRQLLSPDITRRAIQWLTSEAAAHLFELAVVASLLWLILAALRAGTTSSYTKRLRTLVWFGIATVGVALFERWRWLETMEAKRIADYVTLVGLIWIHFCAVLRGDEAGLPRMLKHIAISALAYSLVVFSPPMLLRSIAFDPVDMITPQELITLSSSNLRLQHRIQVRYRGGPQATSNEELTASGTGVSSIAGINFLSGEPVLRTARQGIRTEANIIERVERDFSVDVHRLGWLRHRVSIPMFDAFLIQTATTRDDIAALIDATKRALETASSSSDVRVIPLRSAGDYSQTMTIELPAKSFLGAWPQFEVVNLPDKDMVTPVHEVSGTIDLYYLPTFRSTFVRDIVREAPGADGILRVVGWFLWPITLLIIEVLRRLEKGGAPDPLFDWVTPTKKKPLWSGLEKDALLLLPMIIFDDPRTKEIWQRATLQLSRYVNHSSFANCLEKAENDYYTGNVAGAKDQFTAMARAIYDRLKEDFPWVYEWEPYDPLTVLQPVRLIHQVRSERKGTCLELVLVYLGSMEGFHFYPLYVHLRRKSTATRHALAGYWMIPRDRLLAEEKIMDGVTLRDHVDRGNIRLLDCTGFADGDHVSVDPLSSRTGKLSFEEACKFADDYLRHTDWEVDFAINVCKARLK